MAFGSIRNHKNLDLSIRALLDNPNAFLVVIGNAPSHKDRPLKYYQMLADDLGLSKRVFISDMFVHDEKRLSYFMAADFLLLTHAGSFHSQTSSLTTAVNARRRVLASSGSSPMRDLIEHYGLGVFVEPDSSEAVADGMATLLNSELNEPRWEDYESYATWETNVTRLIQASSDFINNRPTPQRQFEGLEGEAAPLPTIIRARTLLKTKPERVKVFSPAKCQLAGSEIQTESTSPSGDQSLEKARQTAQGGAKDIKSPAASVKPISIPAMPAKRGRKPKATISLDAKVKASSVRKAPAVVIPVQPVKRGRKPKVSVAVNVKANGSAKSPSIPPKKTLSKKTKASQLSRSEKSAMEIARLREINHRRRTLRRQRMSADSSKKISV